MEIKMIVVILSVIFATSSAMVNLTSQWKPNFGWEITCSWRLFANDSLQSVRLMARERQFLVYRPEINGRKYDELFSLVEKIFQVHCYETSEKGDMGKCDMTMDLLQPIEVDMSFACEVSGERPTFRVEKKDIEIAALVPPTKAVIDVAQRDFSGSRVALNCTSTGLPAPSLLWSMGDRKVPNDFSGRSWNATSKLWHTWSLISYTSNDIPVTCTPITDKDNETIIGESAEYSAASKSRGALSISILGVLILALTR